MSLFVRSIGRSFVRLFICFCLFVCFLIVCNVYVCMHVTVPKLLIFLNIFYIYASNKYLYAYACFCVSVSSCRFLVYSATRQKRNSILIWSLRIATRDAVVSLSSFQDWTRCLSASHGHRQRPHRTWAINTGEEQTTHGSRVCVCAHRWATQSIAHRSATQSIAHRSNTTIDLF